MLTAREAMRQAIERAQLGEIEAGTLWLGIARELRLGTVPGRQQPPEQDSCCPDCTQRCDGTCRCHQGPYQHASVGPGDVVYDVTPIDADPATERVYLNGAHVGLRAETEVIQRMAGESTPAYDAAGDSLEDTRLIPNTVAHPRPDSVGPDSTCLACLERVIWIRGRGWVHDVAGHPAGCANAQVVASDGRG